MSDAGITHQGEGALVEAADSPEFGSKLDLAKFTVKRTCKRTFNAAHYQTVLDARKTVFEGQTIAAVEEAIGGRVTGRSGYFAVEIVEHPEAGGKGKLVINFETLPETPTTEEGSSTISSAASSSTAPTRKNTYGCEWEKVEVPVETADCFADIVDDTTALALVQQALDAQNETERANKIEAIGKLSNSESALKLYAKKLKGTTHREIFYPVAEQTLYYPKASNFANPQLDTCGQIETPPSETGAPGGYTYRRCADKIFDDGDWLQRTQQWKGYESVDMDLYGNLAAAVSAVKSLTRWIRGALTLQRAKLRAKQPPPKAS